MFDIKDIYYSYIKDLSVAHYLLPIQLQTSRKSSMRVAERLRWSTLNSSFASAGYPPSSLLPASISTSSIPVRTTTPLLTTTISNTLATLRTTTMRSAVLSNPTTTNEMTMYHLRNTTASLSLIPSSSSPSSSAHPFKLPKQALTYFSELVVQNIWQISTYFFLMCLVFIIFLLAGIHSVRWYRLYTHAPQIVSQRMPISILTLYSSEKLSFPSCLHSIRRSCAG